MKSPAPFLGPLAFSLILSAASVQAGSKLPVEEGLVAAFFANDLKGRVGVGAPVTEWPETSERTAPMTTESDHPPMLMDEGYVGAKTLAVAFEAIEAIQDRDTVAWYKKLPYLNFPTLQGQGEKWEEATVVVVGTGFTEPGIFDMSPGLDPVFRHRGWVQITDKQSNAGIQNPIPQDYQNMPIVQTLVVSRDASRHAVLTAYVNGEQVAQIKQSPRPPTTEAIMEPFEGVVVRPPRPMG
jgi:hypothetical protein